MTQPNNNVTLWHVIETATGELLAETRDLDYAHALCEHHGTHLYHVAQAT